MKKTSVRAKGQSGEREVAALLNPVIHKVLKSKGYSDEHILDPHKQVQRNQMQTANGGVDLLNTYGLAIEVKRQQALNINTWWKQCLKAACDLSHIPVLMYRQNNKKWNVVMWGTPKLDTGDVFRVELGVEDFLVWFESYLNINIDRVQR